jgi:hypothetical protein
MKKYYSFLAFFAILLSASLTYSQCADSSNIYTFNYSGKKYEIVKEMKSWAVAAACAVERGGSLLEINDAAEQDTIFKALINGAKISSTYTQVPDGGGTAYIWIGATDKITEGTWLWNGNNDSSGINFWNGQGAAGAGGGSAVGGKYVNWGGTSKGTVNEPDDFGANQDGGAIALAGWPLGTTMLGSAGEWNDISITNTIYYVIEIDKTTGIKQSSSGNHNNISIYPNPAKNSVNVKLLNSSYNSLTISVFDLMGNRLYEFSGNQSINGTFIKNINTSELQNGNYVVSVVTDGYSCNSLLSIVR